MVGRYGPHGYNAPVTSQVIIEQFHSKALEGNPLGDPVTRRVPVYLPDGYSPSRRYPTIYLLSGFGSRGLRFLNDDLWAENIPQQMDRLISQRQVQPMIVVMPDASTRYGGSQYVNSPATGNYDDHIVELVAYIDGKYSTIAHPAARAIIGHSSGGFGAVWHAMHHADVFGLVADHSGDKCFELEFKPMFGELLRYWERVGDEGIGELLRDPGAGLAAGAPHGVISLLGTAAAYSPNANSPWGFDLPVDLRTGELRAEVWARWLAFDPLLIVEQHAPALRSLKLVYIDCARFDEYNLLYGARRFSQKLHALGIPHHYEEYEGTHRHVRHRYDVSLAAISQAIEE